MYMYACVGVMWMFTDVDGMLRRLPTSGLQLQICRHYGQRIYTCQQRIQPLPVVQLNLSLSLESFSIYFCQFAVVLGLDQ